MAGLEGSGNIIDDDTTKISYGVENIPEKKITFVLKAANNITWWKHLVLFVNVNGNYTKSKEIETKDDKREASVDFFEFEMTDAFKLEFWKGGFGGFGALAASITLNSYDNLSKRYSVPRKLDRMPRWKTRSGPS